MAYPLLNLSNLKKGQPLDKINVTKNALFFLSQAPNHHNSTFNSRFLYELKHKIHLSKGMCGIFHFRFSLAFIKVYVFFIQNFDFPVLKSLFPGHFLGSSNSRRCYADTIEFSNFLLQLKNQRSRTENCAWLFHYFYFEKNYVILKSKTQCFLLNKNINFNKTTESKMENNACTQTAICFFTRKHRILEVVSKRPFVFPTKKYEI